MPTISPKRLILNVDDDEAGRYAVSRLLRQADFDVLEATTGTQALKLAIESPPDLVLLDVNLPDLDGFEVCRRLKANSTTRSIPVVHLTASFLDSSFQARGLDGGADAYLLEPVEPSVLIASVKSMFRIRDAEREVRNYANAWQSTFDSIRDGIAILDSDVKIIQSNASFRALFSEDIEFLVKVKGPSPDISLSDAVKNVEAGGEHAAWEETRGQLSLAISLDPIQTPTGRRGAICVVRDMTERNKMEENLRSTQKLEGIGLLAGGIAHDFNNLLTGVLANASLALEVKELPTKVRNMLEDVVVASERAAELTNQLLAYAGKGRVVEQLIDLSAMVRETLRLLRTSLVTISVELNLDNALPPVLADATQIRQVLMNLIVNAGEAIGKRDGVISITTRTVELDQSEAARLFSKYPLLSGSYVSIEVKDTGTGMDEATLARIFDPFFTTKFIGRGLGLSATLGIVQGHKGAIRVLSAPGAGSSFEVVLPVKEIAVAKLRESGSPNYALPPKPATILVVDDEASVRTMIKTILELDGHTVLTAENGRAGLQVFEGSGEDFDMVLVDLTMPVLGGEETIKALRAIDPLVRIVICTGHSESEAAGLSQMGISGVIRKPFRGSFLRAEVAKYLIEERCTSVV